jgi:hypothetical protein
VEDTEDLLVHDERYAEHRLDPLVQEDRIEQVRVVDAVEDDGAALRGDPTRKAASDRDTNGLLHFFLDSDGRSGHELPAIVVQEQHCAGVDAEDLFRSLEQGREQVVELEVGERGLGQSLQPPQAFGVVGGCRHAAIVAVAAGRLNAGTCTSRTAGRQPGRLWFTTSTLWPSGSST